MNDSDNNASLSDSSATDASSSPTTTAAPAAAGSGTVTTVNATAELEAKLAQAEQLAAGTEVLSPELAAAVSLTLTAPTTTAITQQLLRHVLDYIRETGPNANLTLTDGARQHVLLYRDVQNYLNNAPGDFRKGFSMLLRIIAEQKKNGVFSPRFLFRFVPSMSLNSNDRRALELLFQAVVDLSQASGRATALTQVDLNKVASQALNGEGAQRLIGFFAV